MILVGDEGVIRGLAGTLPANASIVAASQVVGMDEHPALALREKKDSSILVAVDLVKRGEADAVVTAGHTGPGWPPRSCGSDACRVSTGPPSRSR